MPKKFTYEFIKGQFEKEGYKLLSKEYLNNRQKLEYVCLKGHVHSTSWNNWCVCHRCPRCAGQGKPTIEFIRLEFWKEYYKLLTNEYKNAHKKLIYICPKGHRNSINWNMWQRGRRCSNCAGNARKTIEFINNQFEEEGYKLLTKIYRNNSQKLKYICPNGHQHEILYVNWLKGSRCAWCAGNKKLGVEFVKSKFEKEGHILLNTEYINCAQTLNCVCPNGHKYNISWNHWQQGRRCAKCKNRSSKAEFEIIDFIKKFNIEIISNCKDIIINPNTGRGLELDVWMPFLRKAIEYNGEYWHKMSNKHNNDILKHHLCEQAGVDLLVVWDYEWLFDNDAFKNKIKEFVMGS